MPNTPKSLAILKGFYALMSNVKETHKRKNPECDKQYRSFDTPSSRPIKKVKNMMIIKLWEFLIRVM
ncbi:15615_t:CDS:2 [Entrophospora sp. SA101]|nr:15615_t:CDS:2 [Entrophospora sp. SA101]